MAGARSGRRKPDAGGPDVEAFYHSPTGSLSYVVSDAATGRAAVIDPVLDFSAVSGRTDARSAEQIIRYIRGKALDLDWILETHAHADRLTAAQVIREALGGAVAIGAGVRKAQAHFAAVFNLKPPFASDGAPFDRLLRDGDVVRIGKLDCRVMDTPGHTSDSVTYRIGDCAFVGDTLFMADVGTARCDFPGGDAALLYDSIQKIFALPDATRLFMCHDYPPAGRPPGFESTVAAQKRSNVHVSDGTAKDDFVAMRKKRDRTLGLPALLLPAIQVNIRAGRLPETDDNGISYIRIPLDTL